MSAPRALAQLELTTLQVPGRTAYCTIDKTGKSVVPSGRFVTPAGKTMSITHDPFGMAVAPDGSTAVTLHNGVFTVIDLKTWSSKRIPDYSSKVSSPLPKGSFLGVAYSRDSKRVYLSGGDAGTVVEYDLLNDQVIATISLDTNGFSDSFTSDLVFNEATDELLVLDRGNFRMVSIQMNTRKIMRSIPVGRQPFGLAISPDKKTALVANVGQYEYPLVQGMDSANIHSMMIPHHPYGNNTEASKNGTIVDGKLIPGVGDPNVPDAMSVFVIDLNTFKVKAKLKTGFLIGQMVEDAEITGGASPNSVAVGQKYAYVTNATNDNIAVIDYRNGKIIKHLPIQVHPLLDKHRGLIPFGIEMDARETTLYVALLAFNAVAVIDITTGKTKGLIPAGWGTSRVKRIPGKNQLLVTSCRGYGAGPNGGLGFVAPPQGTYVGDVQLATLQLVNIPNAMELKKLTQTALSNTFDQVRVRSADHQVLPALPGTGNSPIKHIVYITKENRTYDEVFGQLQKGDSSLARFGIKVPVKTKNDSLLHQSASITPNHHAIAKKFSYSSNFYCDSDASIHGHHWMLGVIPNEWVETNSSTDKTASFFSKAPGRRFPGSTGSMDPEDYAETGGLWEALERKGVSFYNFGEANETAHVREEWMDTLTGAVHAVMVPMQDALFLRTSRNYAGYNMNIPDQFRVEQFEEEFKKLWLSGKDSMPALVTIQLPNDHTTGPRPDDGYPLVHSYVADNDLALGRMLQFLSHTHYWKSMLVIITEDDPQGGVDHIDAHRSLLLMAGPYVKRGHVSETHANFGSILKVIYNLLGVPYVNQYDLTASLLSDFFTSTPDFAPYRYQLPDARVFDPELCMKKYNRNIDWRKVKQNIPMDHEDQLREKHYQDGN